MLFRIYIPLLQKENHRHYTGGFDLETKQVQPIPHVVPSFPITV